jgi:hypothetical protein
MWKAEIMNCLTIYQGMVLDSEKMVRLLRAKVDGLFFNEACCKFVIEMIFNV